MRPDVAESVRTPMAGSASTGSNILRILIVDDSALDRAETRRLLLKGSERRYSFSEAENIASAVTAIRDNPDGPPDLAIVDFHLPDGNAADLLAALRDATGAVFCPVVVMTGDEAPAIGRRVLRAGAQDFVGKSWMTMESLTRAVENATERWSMLRELQASEERLARAQRAAHLGVWDWNIATGLASWTEQAWRLFGPVPFSAPVTLEFFLSTIHPDDREAAAVQTQTALECGIYRHELRALHPDGTVLWLEVIGEGVFGPSGVPVRLFGTVRDVTARRRADEEVQAALETAQKAILDRDNLVSLISHDLRGPLSIILMGVSALEGRVAEAARTIPPKMARHAQRMAKMLDELLDVSQLRAGKPLELDRHDVDLVSLAREAAEEAGKSSPAHTIDVEVSAPSIVGRWDAPRLERAVTNLLTNAVKYSPGGGRILVTVENVDRDGSTWASVRVTDNGIGVAPADRATIFEWFSRGKNARRASIQGIGIGLAGVRSIVEQHGGTISVESAAPTGSTFIMTLPIADSRAISATTPAEPSSRQLLA